MAHDTHAAPQLPREAAPQLPRESHAAVMAAFNEPVQVRSFPLPREIPAGDLLVRVDLAGMCGTDVHLHRGQLAIPLPMILGHESVGTIVAMGEAAGQEAGGREYAGGPGSAQAVEPGSAQAGGPGSAYASGLGSAQAGGPAAGQFSQPGSASVRRDWLGNELHVGDRVTWSVGLWCDQCWFCRVARIPTRCVSRRAYGVSTPCDQPPHLLGGYGQYHYLHARAAVFKLPDDLPGEAVVGAGCAIVTAVHGIEKMGLTWGESVVVQGAGPVGLASLAIAKEAGAYPVIMIGGPARRLDVARRFGADMTIDLDQVGDAAERRQLVLDATEGRGADAVIECVGEPRAVAEGWELCRDGGRYLVLGHYGDAGPTLLNPHVITRKELTVIGSWGSEPRHTVKALQLLRTRAERYPFAELISHRYRLDQVNEALAAVSSWQTSKAAICPNG